MKASAGDQQASLENISGGVNEAKARSSQAQDLDAPPRTMPVRQTPAMSGQERAMKTKKKCYHCKTKTGDHKSWCVNYVGPCWKKPGTWCKRFPALGTWVKVRWNDSEPEIGLLIEKHGNGRPFQTAKVLFPRWTGRKKYYLWFHGDVDSPSQMQVMGELAVPDHIFEM